MSSFHPLPEITMTLASHTVGPSHCQISLCFKETIKCWLLAFMPCSCSNL